MKCKKPFMKGVLPFGCSQCNPCRISRRRLWTHRMMLESYMHEKSSFVTLTYSDKYVPKELVPKHGRDFLKRLRGRIAPKKLRYYIVGEYGEKTGRPHYHLALFGLGREDAEVMRSCWSTDTRNQESEPLGHIMVGDLTKDSAQYIAGYVTKKMTSPDDPRLQGRYPEFGRMSKNPGLGAPALKSILDTLTSDRGAAAMEIFGDVPSVLKHEGKKWPLGRYLKQKLRKMYGFEETKTPKEKIEIWYQEMQELFRQEDKQTTGIRMLDDIKRQEILVERNKQSVLNMETRQKIYKKGTSL